MIGRIEVFIRRLRRRFSRSEWAARLLRLPLSTGTETAPGLVLIQIDGLAHSELQRAFESGEMPFVRRLTEREHYHVYRQYAGLPTSTAAVQAELFYGVKNGVPGFNFMDRSSGELVRMYEPAVAARIERELEARGGGALLEGGSCYADNFTGGAAEPHFCPSASGWGPALRQANPLVVALLMLSNAYSFLRAAVLLLLEVALAIVDAVRGVIAGQDIFKELKFVPTRVVISILLRELITIGAKIDVTRGLPIIHLNFLGYDEQAHRRGPSSKFAHWTLKGIDDAIARIWRAAHRSLRRHYDIWIYSDHGQEETRSYELLYRRSVADALSEVFADHEGQEVYCRTAGAWGIQLQRVRLFGGKRIQRLFPIDALYPRDAGAVHLSIAPLGPVAMVYYDKPLDAEQSDRLARAMVQRAGMPLVLRKRGDSGALAWTAEGVFDLPRDGVRVLGADHPFLDEVAADLAALCHHKDAGDFVLCGWSAGAQPMSFAIENGSHGGPGAAETTAFAIVPRDIGLHADGENMRATDLRNAALHYLGRSPESPPRAAKVRTAQRETLRIMTYNVHSCIGMDGRLAPERIARVIQRYAPDVVALQELDVGRVRTESADQAHLIAHYLEMDFHFHPAMHLEEERYGDAILSHLPLRLIKAGPLPGLADKPGIEPRGALWVAVETPAGPVQVINTHLGLLARERYLQAQALLGEDWLAHPDCHPPVLLCGDLNARPSSAVCRALGQRLNDAQTVVQTHQPRGTFFGRLPMVRIDHVFVDPSLEVTDIEIPATELVRVASDHLPLIVEVRVSSPAARRGGETPVRKTSAGNVASPRVPGC